MQLIIKNDYQEASSWIAAYIANRINTYTDKNRPFTLGLPTGSSPLGIYRKLIEMYQLGKLSFRNVATFNMDEYVGLPKEHPQSYHTFMWNNFFNHIDILHSNVHILNGNAANLIQECNDYENKIKQLGGIQLFLGGVGPDGHIAFNEPGSSLQSRTRIKTLTEDTLIANSRFFDNNTHKVPRQALTVGVATIMEAKEVIIIACGHQKARALQQAVEGAVNHLWTVTALQLHPKGIIVCDNEATAELKVATYRYFKALEKDIDLPNETQHSS